MTYNILTLALIVALCLIDIHLFARYRKAIAHIARLASEFVKLDTKVDTIDKNTGTDVFRLRKEFEEFKRDYGDAAIEEMRQNAKREKAWAEGIDSIMSYGARYQERGDSR